MPFNCRQPERGAASLITIKVLLAACCFVPLLSTATEFSTKVASELRLDDRSGNSTRFQYKLGLSPKLQINPNWSVHGFALTGDDFASSHNTINAKSTNTFYLRRLFTRYENGENKTEFGILPTYKGRISSTGLSKDGWIQGIRQVLAFDAGKFEWVIGELSDTRASHAIGLAEKLNFVELEFSSSLYNNLSYELGFERILEADYARVELRYLPQDMPEYGVEIIGKIDSQDFKYVASINSQLRLFSQTSELFFYYSYVDQGFGQRAELTEDFLSTGHGFAAELSSSFAFEPKLKWFSKFELYEGNSRIQLGLKYGLTL